MNLASKLIILTYWKCYLLRLKLYKNLIKAKEISFLNLINFIVNTLKITEIDQHLHSYDSMIICIDGLWDSSAAYFRQNSEAISEEAFQYVFYSVK